MQNRFMLTSLSGLQIANLIAFVCCFASFIWAMNHHFRTIARFPIRARAIQVVGGLFTLWHLVALLQARSSQGTAEVMALLLYCASLALFWICVRVNRSKPLSVAFSLDRPSHLMKHGPYRYVRHPFYVSYSLAWIAGIVALAQPWLLLSLLVMGAIYYYAAAMEERKFASGELATVYENYRRHTRMFIPRLWPSKAEMARKKST